MAKVVNVEKDQLVSVTLRLSGDEAAALLQITRHVGGAPSRGNPRAFTDEIGQTLREAGVPEGKYHASGAVNIENRC